MDGASVSPIATHIREMLTMLEKASACTDDSRVSKSHLVKRKRKRRDILSVTKNISRHCIPFNTFCHDGIVAFRQMSAFLWSSNHLQTANGS